MLGGISISLNLYDNSFFLCINVTITLAICRTENRETNYRGHSNPGVSHGWANYMVSKSMIFTFQYKWICSATNGIIYIAFSVNQVELKDKTKLTNIAHKISCCLEMKKTSRSPTNTAHTKTVFMSDQPIHSKLLTDSQHWL